MAMSHFRASIPHGTGVSSGRADRLLLMQSHGCGPRALPASHLKRSCRQFERLLWKGGGVHNM